MSNESTLNEKENRNAQLNQSSSDEVEVNEAEETVMVKDVAKNLGSSTSTINRYSMELEKVGHRFKKRGKARLYTGEDQSLLNRMLISAKELGLSVERAAITALENDDNSITDQLNEIQKQRTQNEVAIQDFSERINSMIELLSDNFATKSEINNVAKLMETIVQQDIQKNEVIEKQNEMILQLKEEKERERKEKEMVQERLNDINGKLNTVVDLYQSNDEKLDKLLKEKEKKGLFGRKWF